MNPTPVVPTSRERALVLGALALSSVLAWSYLGYMAWGMAHMDLGAEMFIMPRMTSWQLTDLALVFLMWAVMMVAMMLPSAAPMVLLFQALGRQMQPPQSSAGTVLFASGYLAIWIAFSALATLLQWELLEARLVSPVMEASSARLAGVLLIGAGAYEFSPLKRACLDQCRVPLVFLVREWRKGVWGAWVMGLRHGFFCLGCCWSLMLLLFVLGVMNLVWIAALAAFVLLEKTVAGGRWVSATGGIAFLAWGAFLLIGN